MGSISPGSQRSMEPRENVVSRFHHFLINLKLGFNYDFFGLGHCGLEASGSMVRWAIFFSGAM